MRTILFIFLLLLTGCPKNKDTKNIAEIEREKALQELMSIEDEDFSEFPEETKKREGEELP
jgi:hypothetical protein